MANILDQITIGDKKHLSVDADPAGGGGTAAEIGSIAAWDNGSGVGRVYIKVGTADTAWDKVSTAESGPVAQGAFRRLAIYSTSPTGFVVDDQIQLNAQNVQVEVVNQATRTQPITYTVPNPGDAVTGADFVLSEGAQTINGNKTFGNNVVVTGNLTVNGALTALSTTNTEIVDKLITLNKNGLANSSGGAGLEFEEAAAIAAFWKISAARSGMDWKVPTLTGVLTLTQLLAASDRTQNFANASGTLVLQPLAPAGVANQIPYWTSTTSITSPAGSAADFLTWDSNNFRLGVGTGAPTHALHVAGTSRVSGAGSLQLFQAASDDRKDQAAASYPNASTAVQTLWSLAVPNNSVVLVTANTMNRKTAGGGTGVIGVGSAYIRTVRVYNIAGVLTLGVVQSDYTSEAVGLTALDCTFDTSGTDLRLRVTTGSGNATANTIAWETTVSYQILD